MLQDSAPSNISTRQQILLPYLACCLRGQKEAISLLGLGTLSPGDKMSLLTHALSFHTNRTLISFSMHNWDILSHSRIGQKYAVDLFSQTLTMVLRNFKRDNDAAIRNRVQRAAKNTAHESFSARQWEGSGNGYRSKAPG